MHVGDPKLPGVWNLNKKMGLFRSGFSWYGMVKTLGSDLIRSALSLEWILREVEIRSSIWGLWKSWAVDFETFSLSDSKLPPMLKGRFGWWWWRMCGIYIVWCFITRRVSWCYLYAMFVRYICTVCREIDLLSIAVSSWNIINALGFVWLLNTHTHTHTHTHTETERERDKHTYIKYIYTSNQVKISSPLSCQAEIS